MVLGGPELVAGGITVVFGGVTVVFGGDELVAGGCAPGVTALEGEGLVCGCRAGVGADCAGVLGGRAPALVAEPVPPPIAPPAPDPPVCENAALVAANMVKAASKPAASQAARR